MPAASREVTRGWESTERAPRWIREAQRRAASPRDARGDVALARACATRPRQLLLHGRSVTLGDGEGERCGAVESGADKETEWIAQQS